MKMNTKQEISEILVKWNMPTRQVAINEIVDLISRIEAQTREETAREILNEVISMGYANNKSEYRYSNATQGEQDSYDLALIDVAQLIKAKYTESGEK